MRVFNTILIGLFLSLSACSAPQIAPDTETTTLNTKPWHLINAQSRLNFISVKKGTIVETHSFGELNGSVDSGGKAEINIVLDSVQTNIDVRNQRMRDHLFETSTSPNAVLSAQIDMAQFITMATGSSTQLELPVSVNMHGKAHMMDISIMVTRLGDNKVVIGSAEPIILDTDMFGFAPGIEKLRTLAKLPAITPQVPIVFTIVFER